MQAKAYCAASEETTLAFKRHILEATSSFASEPMVDLYRVQTLGRMLDRYEELSEKGLGELSCRNRVIYEFGNIAGRMLEEGFEQLEREQPVNLTRWPQLSEAEADRYIHERDAYSHRIALGVLLCTACVAPMMLFVALSEIMFMAEDFFALFGLVGLFAMVGLGVYLIVTAVKPKDQRKIKSGRFSLGRRLKQKLIQLQEAVEEKARRRKGKGIAMIVTSLIPVFAGAAMSEMWYSDAWPILGVGGMFLMIGMGVYELIMADNEKKTMKHLLSEKE